MHALPRHSYRHREPSPRPLLSGAFHPTSSSTTISSAPALKLPISHYFPSLFRVQSLFPRHLRDARHHIRLSRVMKRDVSNGIVVNHLEHCFPPRPCPTAMNCQLQVRRVKTMFRQESRLWIVECLIHSRAWAFNSAISDACASTHLESSSASSNFSIAARRPLFYF